VAGTVHRVADGCGFGATALRRRLRTVAAVTTTTTTPPADTDPDIVLADTSPAPQQPLGAAKTNGRTRRPVNRHLDRLLSPGKDPADPTGRAFLPPVMPPAEVAERALRLAEAHRVHQLTRPDIDKRVEEDSATTEATKVREFLLYAGVREPGRDPADYDRELILRYRGELSQLGAPPTTLNAMLMALRKFFDMLLPAGTPNPARAIPLAKTSKKSGQRPFYTPGQADAILAAAARAATGPRPRSGRPLTAYRTAWNGYAIVALWVYAGPDPGALPLVRIADVDLAGQCITWRDSDDRPLHSQLVPAQLVAILADYLRLARPGAAPDELLLINPQAQSGRGGPMNDQSLIALARRAAADGGAGEGTGRTRGRGQGHTPQRWRNTYARRILRTPRGSLLTLTHLFGLKALDSADTYACFAVGNQTVTVEQAHAGLTAPAGLRAQAWPHALAS
jgi:integrase